MLLLKCPTCGAQLVDGLSRPAKKMYCPECSSVFTVGEGFVAIQHPRVILDLGAELLSVGLYYYSHRSKEDADRSIQELDGVLRPHGIIYGLDGSRCHQIVVAKAQAQLAARLLRRARFKVGKVKLHAEYATWYQRATRRIARLAEWAHCTQFIVSLWFYRRHAAHQRC